VVIPSVARKSSASRPCEHLLLDDGAAEQPHLPVEERQHVMVWRRTSRTCDLHLKHVVSLHRLRKSSMHATLVRKILLSGGDMAMQHGLYEDIMACIEQSMGKEADDSAEKKNVGRSDADNFLQ
jgi:hypothetical protein